MQKHFCALVLLIIILLREETVIFSSANFQPTKKQVNQNILEILSTSSILELKLIGSSSKECCVIKLIAHKYLELIYIQII